MSRNLHESFKILRHKELGGPHKVASQATCLSTISRLSITPSEEVKNVLKGRVIGRNIEIMGKFQPPNTKR